jgi:single-stranded-DNA-specific exonuclease
MLGGRVTSKCWRLPTPVAAPVKAALARFNPLEQQLLAGRGIKTESQAEAFLEGQVPYDDDARGLKGIDLAVARLAKAIQAGELIVVYGDYDVDGLTSAALVLRTLRDLEAQARPYIPNRFEEGYGLNAGALAELASQGASLILTVDSGVRAIDEIRQAAELGLEVIVTDHHEPGHGLPEAMAIVNPRQAGDNYPFKDFAGVGVAYKLTQALRRHMGGEEDPQGLVLVALGTVADVVPLIGENRRLVRAGLEAMRQLTLPGVQALIASAGLNQSSLDSQSIAFILGPRLNAAGRIGAADQALELLMATDLRRAATLAESLERANAERRQLTERVLEAARLRLEAEPPKCFILVDDPDFNEGVIGLAAARLVDEHYRPAAVACRGPRFTRASARSIPEFHITRALDECADLLVRYGGHAMAAGFTVATENLEELRQRLEGLATSALKGEEWNPRIDIDAVASFDQLDDELLRFLDLIEPTGHQNPQPLLLSRGLRILERRTVGKQGAHLKLRLGANRRAFDAIGFSMGEMAGKLPERVDAVYRFERNEYQGTITKQLRLADLRPAES